MNRAGFFDPEGARATHARLRRERAERELAVRQRRTAILDRAKQIVQRQPGDTVALLECLIPLLGGDEFRLAENVLIARDDERQQQADDGLLPTFDHSQAAFEIVHPISPADSVAGVNGGSATSDEA